MPLKSPFVFRKIFLALGMSTISFGMVGEIARAESLPETKTENTADGESSFFRILKDSEGRPMTMSTSVVHFQGNYISPKKISQQVKVDLISAVHVAEPSYYAELNRRFEKYDAVLFELIAPDDLSADERKALKEREGNPSNPLSAMQQALKNALGLEFQLQKIDYGKPNFVHADLSPEGFSKAMEKRGDNIWSLFARLIIQGFAEQEKRGNPFETFLLMTAFISSSDSSRPYVLRRYLAENFRQMDSLVEKIEGPQGSTLVTDRNNKALEVLRSELKKGKKTFAIFYGAAHMPRFEESLEKNFGMQKGEIEWIPAWHLQAPSESRAGLPSEARAEAK